MKHLRAVNRKARRIDEIVTSRREDVVALQDSGGGAEGRISPPDVRSRFFQDGKWIRPAARPVSASPWSAIFTIATLPASGPRRFPIM